MSPKKSLVALCEIPQDGGEPHDVILDPAVIETLHARAGGGTVIHFNIPSRDGVDTGSLHVEESHEEVLGLMSARYTGPEMWSVRHTSGNGQTLRAAHVQMIRHRDAWGDKPSRSIVHMGHRVLTILESPDALADKYEIAGILEDEGTEDVAAR